jgi:hypothetical protein
MSKRKISEDSPNKRRILAEIIEAQTSDLKQITFEQVFNREKSVALELITQLKSVVQQAEFQTDLQYVPPESVMIERVSEDLYERVMEQLPRPMRMLELASKVCSHLKNIETIVSLLRGETDYDEDPDW